MLLKQKSIPSQKLGPQEFWGIANSALNKGKSAISPLFNDLELLFAASDKAKLFPKIFFLRTLILMTWASLNCFLSRTYLKLHTIFVTTKIKTNLDSSKTSKTSGPDCIQRVVLKNCEPEISYILTDPFNMCLKQSCFPDCWKVSSVVPVFKNVGESSTAKNYCPASLLSVVSKVFEKLVNNRIIS